MHDGSTLYVPAKDDLFSSAAAQTHCASCLKDGVKPRHSAIHDPVVR